MPRQPNVVHFNKNSAAKLDKFPKRPDFTISESGLELYRKIQEISNEIFLHLGDCYREEVYTQALAHEIRGLGYDVETEVECDVLYKTAKIGKIRADLVARSENSFIIESKRVDYYKGVMQLLGYMKSLAIPVGFTVGFGKDGAKVWCVLREEGTRDVYMYDGLLVREVNGCGV
jgi:GxxExxY protein